jgi:glycerol-3-phosphate O-acyltransferase
MTGTITLPLWAFVLLAFLAGWAALVLLLTPGMRWFFRRRLNVVIGDINTRLRVKLPSFKLTRRQVLVDRLFHDPVVQAAASAHARDAGASLRDTWHRVDRYAREIVPSFNVYIYFRVGYALGRTVARALYRVRIGYVDEEALALVSPQSAIVFVINHRSNMDYVLAAFLAAERTALSYAVGEWARIWPLQQLIRSMGAYFVRRNSGDPLYRVVLSRYVHMATMAGVTQAVFPEGSLTIDGRLRAPKFGLLDYMLKGFDADGERDVVFIPVGINYDRVLEDRTQLLKLRPGAPRPGLWRGCVVGARFCMRNLRLILGGRWHRRLARVLRRARGVGRPRSDRGPAGTRRRPGDRRARLQRGGLRRQGGHEQPGADGARRLVAATAGEVHPVASRELPDARQAPPDPPRVLGGVR